MRISTVIPAYNCEPFLRRAVESLVATGYPDLEVIIVDDGSRDETLKIAVQLQTEHAGVVRVMTHPGRRNRGVSASRNLGMQSSTGELLAFLDADDFVYPCRFQSAVELLSSRPDIDAVHQICQVEVSDDESPEFWRDGNLMFGFKVPVLSQQILFELMRGYCWATSAVVFRRGLLAEIGLFDEQLKVCEDCHFWMRMACCGAVVSGDLTQPVSVYWRRAHSAYQPSPWQRLNMIQAMSSFYSWMKRRDPSDSRLPRVANCIAQYILTGVENARLNGDRLLAWSLISRSAFCFPRICRENRLYGNLVRLALGR